MPGFVVAYLNSSFGQDHMIRNASGMVQQGLSLEKVRRIPVPKFNAKVQNGVAQTVLLSLESRRRAMQVLKDAEQTLLQALGLENWQPPEPLTYVRSAAEVFSAGRFDAEHFQPKFDALRNRIRECGLDMVRLGDVMEPVINGFDCRDFVDQGTPYIRVGDVKKGCIDLAGAQKIPIAAKAVSKDIGIQVGDVLFTRKGSYGNAAHVRPGQEDAIISSEIMRIRIRTEWQGKLLPEVLAAYLNSLAGSYQAEKWAHGVAFYSISQEDLAGFEVAILSRKEQENIKSLIDKAEQARRRSHALLEQAKRAVEIAIEESEASALRFLAEPLDD